MPTRQDGVENRDKDYWQPAARGRGRQPCSSGGKQSQSTQGGKGKCPKTCTFSREVVLLKTPDDCMVRGGRYN